MAYNSFWTPFIPILRNGFYKSTNQKLNTRVVSESDYRIKLVQNWKIVIVFASLDLIEILYTTSTDLHNNNLYKTTTDLQNNNKDLEENWNKIESSSEPDDKNLSN